VATSEKKSSAEMRVGRICWWICGFLFLATTVNYVDRNSISVLTTTIRRALCWSEADYGGIAFAFTAVAILFGARAGQKSAPQRTAVGHHLYGRNDGISARRLGCGFPDEARLDRLRGAAATRRHHADGDWGPTIPTASPFGQRRGGRPQCRRRRIPDWLTASLRGSEP
jgi:hypothetical protein